MLEQVLSRDKMVRAPSRVKANRGAFSHNHTIVFFSPISASDPNSVNEKDGVERDHGRTRSRESRRPAL